LGTQISGTSILGCAAWLGRLWSAVRRGGLPLSFAGSLLPAAPRASSRGESGSPSVDGPHSKPLRARVNLSLLFLYNGFERAWRSGNNMILVIDNYDSFTYNLVQYLGELGAQMRVVRNDQTTVDEIERKLPNAIVISPGPKTPNEAGICLEVIDKLAGRIPILGVCLGHQAIGQAFGGKVIRAPELMHGKTSQIHHDGRTIFEGLPNPFEATRYHSLIVERESLPARLEISATSPDGLIMGLRHRQMKVEGVQFHPESILTQAGKQLLANFLKI
jgi:anthranilate synthase/aminodeoxychorismate synthase-like glutamine amidotransferase